MVKRLGGLALVAICAAGCARRHLIGASPDDPGPGRPDLATLDLAMEREPCAAGDPACHVAAYGSGATTYPTARGFEVDARGYLELDSAGSAFLWVADSEQYAIGLISKIDTRPRATWPTGAVNTTYREVARYLTVTCDSNPEGHHQGLVLGTSQKGSCDGTTGCCDRAPLGSRSAVQVIHNQPSRVAVDTNGDAWVANRAHIQLPHQSSVTKIANRPADCVDRNHNGRIETSSDIDDNGIITTDCDADGHPDDGATVCTGGRSHEFYGLDDECVLFTTNTGDEGGVGRPLTLAPGVEGGPADAWAGRWNDGVFYRIDGATGLIKSEVTLAPSGVSMATPYSAVVDREGILWAPSSQGFTLNYFDTHNPNQQGSVTGSNLSSGGGPSFLYGAAVDDYSVVGNQGQTTLIQQIWLGAMGGGAVRYRPVRDGSFDSLKNGTWAQITFDAVWSGKANGGRGIAVDNRGPSSFAWLAVDGTGWVGQIPIGIADGSHVLTTLHRATGAGALGVGVDARNDVWSVNQEASWSCQGGSVTHFSVDSTGQVAAPTMPQDHVNLDDNPSVTHPCPYTYSDLTGFSYRSHVNPPRYRMVVPGCSNGRTVWRNLTWDAETPSGASLSFRARAIEDPAHPTGAWSSPQTASPVRLDDGTVMEPSGYLEIEVDLEASAAGQSPMLKGLHVGYTCDP